MEKDFYDYVLTPTAKEIRKESLMERLRGMKHLNIVSPFTNINYGKDNAINNGLMTWNNQILALKYYYALALKYYKYYKKSSDDFSRDAYDYWCRKNMEIIIILLSSQFDKGLNIVNSLFDMRIKRSIGFQKKIIKWLQNNISSNKNISNFYNDFQDVIKNYIPIINDIRNNVVHNYSDLYPSFEIEIDTATLKEKWFMNKEISLEEGFKKIEDCVDWLEKLMIAINNNLITKYPPK